MAVAYYGRDARNCGELVRRSLRVAARDQDACFGIGPVDLADVGARFAVRLRGDAAGVDDDHIGFRGLLDAVVPGGTQTLAYRLAIGTRGAAAEVLDVEGERHSSSVRGT